MAKFAKNPKPPDGVDANDFFHFGWQSKNRITSKSLLQPYCELSEEEAQSFDATGALFRFAITPYYASLIDPKNPNCPIRKQVVPQPEELAFSREELGDPLGEEQLEAAPNVIHRYPDRVLLLVTDRCPVYCRFCTRRRIVGRTERQMTRALLKPALDYIRTQDQIREVILSGGDALMLSDAQLDFILSEIRKIEHIDIVRIATRVPVTSPMRVTRNLAETLRKHGPVYLMTHFNHPNECTELARDAVGELVDAGVVVYNQSVLLRDINDSVDTIRTLNRLLVSMRATPYYLHQCDLAKGTEHFRTPLSVGLDIIEGLRGHTSGLMVPQLCVDVPGGLGKVTVQPDWVLERNGRDTVLRTYQGETAIYTDPEARPKTA